MTSEPSSEAPPDEGVRIETDQLVLREFRADDLDAVHEYASDEEVVRYLRWGPNTREQTERWLEEVLAERDGETRYVYTLAVTLPGDDRVIGACRLVQPVHTEKAGRVSFVLNKNYWRKGIMAEAVSALVRFAFEEVGLNRISGTTPVENWGSGLVLEKAGLQKEGLVDHHLLTKDGRWVDAKIYSVLKSSWPPKPE